MTPDQPQLSPQALAELWAIAKDEIPEPLTDIEIEEMGVRLLRLFSILSVPEPKSDKITVSDHDYKALSFLFNEIQAGRNPSIRDLCRAMGLRSSRSGFRLLKKYFKNGWVWRDQSGSLRMFD